MGTNDANQQSIQTLDYSNRLLEAVTSLTVEIGKASSKDEVLALIPAWVPRIVPADRASVAFPVDDDHLGVFAFEGDKAIPVGMPLPIDSTFVGSVFAEQKVKRCQDLSADPGLDSQKLAQTLGSCMDAPMMSQGRAIGTLNVASFEKHAYTVEHEALLLHIAAVIAAQLNLLDQFFETQDKLEAMVAARTQVIEQQKADLKEAMREAQSANRLKSEFLASISHELRTPMNGIIGLSEIMLDGDLGEQESAYTKEILGSAESLLAMINDILDLSKIEAGPVSLDKSAFDLRALVDDVFEALKADASAKGLDLIAHFALGTPRVVVGDSMRIRQILTNLVGNAIKFTEQGRVMATVTLARSAGAGSAGDRPAGGDDEPVFRITIEDTGIGVPADKHGVIFERFTQADGAWTREKGGTGLGLAICKELVGLMGGTIGLESEVGVGSRFWFELPMPEAPAEPAEGDAGGATSDLAPADQGAAQPQPPQSESPQSEPMQLEPAQPETMSPAPTEMQPPLAVVDAPLSEDQIKEVLAGLQVLLVEDNRLNREVAENNLARMGVDVTIAENGKEAVDWVKKKNFNAILMDCQMPVMDGFEASRIISGMIDEGAIPQSPIIAVTANAMMGDRERCLEAGMDDYVAKPIRKMTLANVLNQWCGSGCSQTRPPDPIETGH